MRTGHPGSPRSRGGGSESRSWWEDQYASTVSYKTTIFGSKALTAGSHKLRLTISGKNSASSSYYSSSDSWVLVKQ